MKNNISDLINYVIICCSKICDFFHLFTMAETNDDNSSSLNNVTGKVIEDELPNNLEEVS